MALIKPIHGEMKGSIAGNTFQGGASGMVVRQRRKPVNPNSPAQSDRRRILAFANGAWKLTPQGVKDAYDEYAQNTPLTNKFGDPNIITGRQMFVRLNTFRAGAGITFLSGAPPTPGMTVNPDFDLITNTTDGVQVNNYDLGFGADDVQQIQLAGPFASSRQKHKGPWRQTSYVNSDTSSPFTLLAAAGVSIGQVYFVAWRAQDDEGRLSEQFLIKRSEVFV